MAQSANKNLAKAENQHHTGTNNPRTYTTQYDNSNTNEMNLLDTLKSMTHACNKRMQDVNDCRDSHRDMLEAGHEYPANCELERMERMAKRAKQYWQRMKNMCKHHEDVIGPERNLDEIAINVKNLGELVDQLVRASTHYSNNYKKTGERKDQRRTQGDKHGKRQQTTANGEEDEYRDILYFDTISLRNGRREQTKRESNEENASAGRKKKREESTSDDHKKRSEENTSINHAKRGEEYTLKSHAERAQAIGGGKQRWIESEENTSINHAKRGEECTLKTHAERAQANGGEKQRWRETPQAGAGERREVALFGRNRRLPGTNDEQQLLKKGEHVRKAISKHERAEEYATRIQPIRRGEQSKRRIEEARGGGQVKYFEHTGRGVDFTKGPCRRMSTIDVGTLDIKSLAIVDTEYDDKEMERAKKKTKGGEATPSCAEE